MSMSMRRAQIGNAGRPTRLVAGLAAFALSLIFLSCSPLVPHALGNPQTPVQRIATVDLSDEEQAYVDDSPPLRVGITDGAAPLVYVSTKGQAQGIGVRVLDEVALRTGLKVDYHIHSDQASVFASGSDLFPLISPNYIQPGMVLSTPYLVTETVLFMNKSVSGEDLHDKRYAAVGGGVLPVGIDESRVLYYGNREYAIDAVERGLADYGYANAYSIAYLTLKKGYRNLVTVPQGMEERRYSVALYTDDPVLLSIINKGLASITDSQMQALILDEASRVERTITIRMIMEQYGVPILLISFLLIVVLVFLSATTIQSAVQLRRQNRRYEALFEISHEYLFEYEPRSRRVVLAPQTIALFASMLRQEKAMEALVSVMERVEESTFSSVVDLTVGDGSLRTFRLSIAKVSDSLKRVESYLGKLSDISEDEREKADLRTKVVTDGLTGLLNQVAVREEIEGVLATRPRGRLDFLVLMDCDKFKQVNDTYGHLAGDRFLKNLGESLVSIFGDDTIIGRVGGDEFCVYVPAGDSAESVLDQCNLINPTFQQRIKAPFSVSVGVAPVETGDEYDSLFRRADIALYQIKERGGAAVGRYLPSMGT